MCPVPSAASLESTTHTHLATIYHPHSAQRMKLVPAEMWLHPELVFKPATVTKPHPQLPPLAGPSSPLPLPSQIAWTPALPPLSYSPAILLPGYLTASLSAGTLFLLFLFISHAELRYQSKVQTHLLFLFLFFFVIVTLLQLSHMFSLHYWLPTKYKINKKKEKSQPEH